MLKRLVTGAAYIAVLLAFFIPRVIFRGEVYAPILFDGLILLFTVLGTFEICRALGERIDRLQKWIVGIFSAGIVLCFAVSDTVYKWLGQEAVNYAPQLTFTVFMAGVAVLLGLLVFRHEKTPLDSAAYSFFALLYPAVFLLVLCGVNHMPSYSEIGILFVFAICPFADCFAFVFGVLLGKKFPMKMAPHVSPNKTVIGGIGGILGGALGAVAIFFIYYGLIVPTDLNTKWTNLVFFIGLGVLTALFAELGDLAESAVKRRIGIKDMGKLLPGHGGILDRIDSALYACLIVCFVLVIRIMTTG